ncbi:hypothetical protein OIU77_001092 [Salix suchowensis]|uniref:Secreted protein n=1 Tax=Salix suchowensis TaxID=1278906 RepID=A0ABQ9BA45_9ROSI|nr:hypothetical protein OIU77_001092 [Salix suchowensis]
MLFGNLILFLCLLVRFHSSNISFCEVLASGMGKALWSCLFLSNEYKLVCVAGQSNAKSTCRRKISYHGFVLYHIIWISLFNMSESCFNLQVHFSLFDVSAHDDCAHHICAPNICEPFLFFCFFSSNLTMGTLIHHTIFLLCNLVQMGL